MKSNKIDFIELGKGLLIVFSYFLIGSLLTSFFSVLIKKGIFPDTKTIRIILNFLIYLILALFYCFLYRKLLIKDWKVFKKKPKEILKTGVTYWLRGLFIMILSNAILVIFLKMGNSVNEQANIELIKRSMITQIPLTIILAPLIEEIIFRGSFSKMTKNPHYFAFITGIVFGFMHVVSSLDNPLGILYLIPYSSMGVAFGYLYKKTDTIYASLFMHMIHNAITISFIVIAIVLGVY